MIIRNEKLIVSGKDRLKPVLGQGWHQPFERGKTLKFIVQILVLTRITPYNLNKKQK